MKFSLSPRAMLLIVAVLFFAPLVLAWLMFNGSLDIRPSSTRNLGTLVEPPVPIDWTKTVTVPAGADWATVAESTADIFKNHWVVLQAVAMDCNDSCLQQIAGLRQIYRASGRHQLHIRLALLLDDADTAENAERLRSIYSEFQLIEDPSALLWDTLAGIQADISGQAGPARGVYLVDPQANIMMFYEPGSDPNHIKKDLKRLLTFSKLDK